MPAKAAVTVKPVQAPVKVQSKESVKVTLDKVVPAQVVVPVKTSAPLPSVPPRAGRPSSRLAQLTVPSMAQSVASTAAKASYTQTIPKPLIVPPLASAIKKDPKLANNWKTKPLAQLTAADLMAMPDDAYMNDVQLAYFRVKLVSLKLEIQSNAVDTTEHLREDTVVVPDPADRATIEEEHALELRTRDRERKLLKKIEQSIMRIDSGDYGYCDETGESIGVGRLLATWGRRSEHSQRRACSNQAATRAGLAGCPVCCTGSARPTDPTLRWPSPPKAALASARLRQPLSAIARTTKPGARNLIDCAS